MKYVIANHIAWKQIS